MKFKRAFLVAEGRFEIMEIEENINPNEVMVKIASCGMCNFDLNFWDGRLNFYGYPHRLGHEFAGTIVEVGAAVADYKVGDKVAVLMRGFGGYSEYRAVAADRLQKLADDIDPKYALGEPQKCIMTVLRAIRPEAGDYGVILGCGPMGLWTVMGLKGNYLGGLIAVDLDDDKLALAKKYGATHVINSRKEDVAIRLADITAGRMADWVVEGTGIPALLNAAQDYLKKSGRGKLILMSSHAEACKEFDFRKAIERSLEIIVAHPGHSANEDDDFRRAVEFTNKHTFEVKELITHEWKLSEINEAFRNLEHKPPGYLKGIIVPD